MKERHDLRIVTVYLEDGVCAGSFQFLKAAFSPLLLPLVDVEFHS